MSQFNSPFGIGDRVSYQNPNAGFTRPTSGNVISVKFSRNGNIAYSILNDSTDVVTQNIRGEWVTPYVIAPLAPVEQPRRELSDEEDDRWDESIIDTRPINAESGRGFASSV